jgi:predicted dienelactone hydrolase
MRRLLPVLLTAAIVTASCGSDSNDEAVSTTAAPAASSPATDAPSDPPATEPVATEPAGDPPATEAPTETPPPTVAPTTTTAEPAVTAAELAGPGPYAVGVVTRALPEGNAVEIWYPADESARGGTVDYTVRSFLPPAIADLVPDTIDDTRSIDATRDAAPAADGPFPIVLFSHGAAGFRLQSSVLARHLASWGIVTASTDHPSRDLFNFIGGTSEGQPPSIDDFRSMRTLLTTLDDDEILGGALDNDRIALGGHSAGGRTIVQMAEAGDGILGYVSYASGLGDTSPAVPSLFMAGERDMVADPVELTYPAFERAPSPSWLWSFADAGHLLFSDLCAIGSDGINLIDLADAAGIGGAVDDDLRRLGSDGCEEPNRPVEEIWPGVHQAATGFYRWVFGIDAEPIGLDESVVTTGVTVTDK